MVSPVHFFNQQSGTKGVINGAELQTPLTHSLIPDKGSVTISATRSGSTETGLKHNPGGTGLLQIIDPVADEAMFPGAMRLYNRWGIQSATLAVSASNSMTLTAGDYLFSMGAGTGTATFSGTGGATGTLAASASGRVQVLKTITAGTLIVTGSVAILTDLMVLNVTGESDQTTPRPYVSVGVLSAPYHGCNVDGVKCFATDLDGNLIPASQMTGMTSWVAATNLTFRSALTAGVTPFPTAADAAVTTSAVMTRQAGIYWIRIEEKATTANHQAYWGNAAITAGATHTVAFDVKFDNVTKCRLSLGNAGGVNGFYVDVDNTGSIYATGVMGTGTYTSSTIKAVAGGYRVTITGIVDGASTLSYPLVWCLNAAGTASYLGTVGRGFYVQFCQTEVGSQDSPYIDNPSAVAAATRNKWVESYTTSGMITAAAGTVALAYNPGRTPSGTVALWGSYVDASNYTAILHDATNLIFRKRISGTNYDATIANAFVSGTSYKLCASWGASGTTIYLNGTAGTPHANTTSAQLAATMQVGADGNGGQQANMSVGGLLTYVRQLSGSEQGAIST